MNTGTRIPSPAHLAHRAVFNKANGENITPATIRAWLTESGANERQADSATKVVCALIPTVTTASLRKWAAANAVA